MMISGTMKIDLKRSLGFLPIEEREIVFDRIIRNESNQYGEGRRCKLFYIDHIFTWSASPEGFDYWSNLCRRQNKFVYDSQFVRIENVPTFIEVDACE
jgi:hypothetical protein